EGPPDRLPAAARRGAGAAARKRRGAPVTAPVAGAGGALRGGDLPGAAGPVGRGGPGGAQGTPRRSGPCGTSRVELLDEALAQGECDGVGAVGRPHLREDVRDVGLHRLGPDAELPGDLLVGLAVRQELQEVVLPRGRGPGPLVPGLVLPGDPGVQVPGDRRLEGSLALRVGVGALAEL